MTTPNFHHAPLRNRISPTTIDKAWEGDCPRKPWDYKVCAVIPVLDTPETLPLIVDLLRLQTERPYIVIVDTGSTPENLALTTALRAEDVEVHSLLCNGVLHPSDFVVHAMDLAQSLCRSEWMFCTHADCFPRIRTLIADLLLQAEAASCPAIGYEISPRPHSDWKGMLGHTCTLLHVPTLDEIGAGWSMRRLVQKFRGRLRFTNETLGETGPPPDHRPHIPNWPDTELLLNYTLRNAGIDPILVGHEENAERTLDERIDHCRTFTSGKLYDQTYYEIAQVWIDDALNAARLRVAGWRHDDSLRERVIEEAAKRLAAEADLMHAEQLV